MQLTAAQTRRIQAISNLIQKYYGESNINSGCMSFTLECVGDSALLCASNTDGLRWFDTHYTCYVIISKQGGIHRYSGEMNPKLVLPATPRLCDYRNPFKKVK